MGTLPFSTYENQALINKFIALLCHWEFTVDVYCMQAVNECQGDRIHIHNLLISNCNGRDSIKHAVIYISTDNHPVHHVQEVINHIYDSGVIIRFLPPYSSDLNPIEEVFSQVKHYLRQNHLVLQSVRDPSPIIWEAFGQITPANCIGYMHHAGYI